MMITQTAARSPLGRWTAVYSRKSRPDYSWAASLFSSVSYSSGLSSWADVTKIVIAQRVTSVMNTDQIVILDDGKVHAIGTHQELLAHDPIYQEIYHTQMKGGEE